MDQDFKLPWVAASGSPHSLALCPLLDSLTGNTRSLNNLKADDHCQVSSLVMTNIQANQDITACVAADPGACGIQYELKDLQVFTFAFSTSLLAHSDCGVLISRPLS